MSQLAQYPLPVIHTPLNLDPILSLRLGCYVDRLWALSKCEKENEETGPGECMDRQQHALHRMVFHHITTKPSARLGHRIASLTNIHPSRTYSWFDEERSRHDVLLFSIFLDTGEEVFLRGQSFGDYVRHYRGWSGFSLTSKTQDSSFWSDDWFDRVVELYWERLLSEKYQGFTIDRSSLGLLLWPHDLPRQDIVRDILACLDSLG